MRYISTAEAAEKWHISSRRVVRLANEGRIAGATVFAGTWMIPENAEKPVDGRTKQAKKAVRESSFRFPLLVNASENSYNPPLSAEEALLRTAQLDFCACDFEKAYQIFPALAERAESIYVKIAALFYMCILPAAYKPDDNWNAYCMQFGLCFEEEFPYKKEMKLFLTWLDMVLGRYLSASEKYRFDKEYIYDKSARGMNAYISIAGLRNSDNLDSYEIICQNMENDGYYYEAEELNLSMFWLYMLNADEKSMLYHLNKAMKIAYDTNFVFPLAKLAPYYADIFNTVLKEYPDDFAERVRTCGEGIYNRYAQFSQKSGIPNIYAVLSKKEYRLVMYAVMGYSYKQVADIMSLSERTIAVKYSAIFDKLNIANKRELHRVFLDVWGEKNSWERNKS